MRLCISTNGKNMSRSHDTIAIQAPTCGASGVVLESHVDSKQGPTATLTVQNGNVGVWPPACTQARLRGGVWPPACAMAGSGLQPASTPTACVILGRRMAPVIVVAAAAAAAPVVAAVVVAIAVAVGVVLAVGAAAHHQNPQEATSRKRGEEAKRPQDTNRETSRPPHVPRRQRARARSLHRCAWWDRTGED